MARVLGCSQGNVSFYERGSQEIPPERAKRLVGFAKSKGLRITAGQIYGLEPIQLAPAPSAISTEPAATEKEAP